MHSEAANLNAGTAYTITREAYHALQAMQDRRSPEARELEAQVAAWTAAKHEIERTLNAMGPRYAHCTFDSYICRNDAQREALKALQDYARNAKANLESGRNVILAGPKGSGKDHLLTALAKAVFAEAGAATHWRNGLDLLEDFHKWSLDPDSKPYRDPYRECPILYLSDPLPPSGALSEAKQAQWFALADARYRALRPTWVSMNVADGMEAEARLGAQTIDRLRDKALVIYCRWESYRQPHEIIAPKPNPEGNS